PWCEEPMLVAALVLVGQDIRFDPSERERFVKGPGAVPFLEVDDDVVRIRLADVFELARFPSCEIRQQRGPRRSLFLKRIVQAIETRQTNGRGERRYFEVHSR